MSFPNEGNTMSLPVLPDAERFRAAVKSQMRSSQKANDWERAPNRILKGYVYMTSTWTGIFNIKRTGTYRGMPVLSQYRNKDRGICHNDGLLQYNNKKEAIQALLAFRKVLDEIPAKVKFLRIDKLWLEDSMMQLGLNYDSGPPAKGRICPEAAYLLYLYINW